MILIINRTKNFVVENCCDGDEIWMPKHPLDNSKNEIVVSFDRPFQDITKDNAYVILATDQNGSIEIMYFLNGIIKDFAVCVARHVPKVIRSLELKYNP